MLPRLSNMAARLRAQALWARGSMRPASASFVCRSCVKSFSATARQAVKAARAKASKETVKEKPGMYKSRLLIYDAGDTRTTWVSFWKALALLQFGTTMVFAVPPLWKNTNQPDPRLRKATAILVGVLGTIPTLTMAYVTAPFAHQVFLQIPQHARRSRQDLMAWANTLVSQPAATANTKLEFVTLRIFPFRRNTSAFLHELRALPPRRLRLANIEIPKSDAWAQRQRAKGIGKRILEVINEPRFKFYVKEGRLYTMKTGAPGVWEAVAQRISQQTLEEEERNAAKQEGLTKPRLRLNKPLVRRPVAPSEVRAQLKRQTARSVAKREA